MLPKQILQKVEIDKRGAMEEQMKPGSYTALDAMNIRAAMNTMVNGNIVGGYKNGSLFTVYEVFPEKGGIVWGRVSSNTGGGTARYVALRVNNHPKAQMVPLSEPIPGVTLLEWAQSVDAWLRVQGYKGPKPG